MDSTAKPKPADDPHDLLEVAPGVALVAPSDAADPTDEELSSLLRAAARRRSGAPPSGKSDVAALPTDVDTTFRPAAVNAVRTRSARSSAGRRTILSVIGFVIALSVVLGAAAWQFYGDATTQMVARWVPQLGPARSPQDSGPAEQPSPAAAQASEVTAAASEPSAESAPQGVVPAVALEAPTLQSMARDVATLGQKVEQLQATIEQLKASQDQMSRELAKGSEGKASESKAPDSKASDTKASEQNQRPRTFPQALRPAHKPIAAFRQPQVTAAPASAPPASPYYGQRQPEPSPSAAQQLIDPELSSVPRPPLPLHQ